MAELDRRFPVILAGNVDAIGIVLGRTLREALGKSTRRGNRISVTIKRFMAVPVSETPNLDPELLGCKETYLSANPIRAPYAKYRLKQHLKNDPSL